MSAEGNVCGEGEPKAGEHRRAGAKGHRGVRPSFYGEFALPRLLPIQPVEVEVLAELLDALPLAANDNGVEGE